MKVQIIIFNLPKKKQKIGLKANFSRPFAFNKWNNINRKWVHPTDMHVYFLYVFFCILVGFKQKSGQRKLHPRMVENVFLLPGNHHFLSIQAHRA